MLTRGSYRVRCPSSVVRYPPKQSVQRKPLDLENLVALCGVVAARHKTVVAQMIHKDSVFTDSVADDRYFFYKHLTCVQGIFLRILTAPLSYYSIRARRKLRPKAQLGAPCRIERAP